MRHDGGKGDSPRPFSVDLNKFAENFDLIFGKKKDEKAEQEGTEREQDRDGDSQRMGDQK